MARMERAFRIDGSAANGTNEFIDGSLQQGIGKGPVHGACQVGRRVVIDDEGHGLRCIGHRSAPVLVEVRDIAFPWQGPALKGQGDRRQDLEPVLVKLLPSPFRHGVYQDHEQDRYPDGGQGNCIFRFVCITQVLFQMLRPPRLSIRVFLLLGSMAAWTACRQAPAAELTEEAAWTGDHTAPDDKWGYLDTGCALAIFPVFDDAGPFSGGLAAVNQGGRWGFIDKHGRMVVPLRFRSAWTFHEGLARVATFDGDQFFVRSTGQVIRGSDWQADDDFSEGLARIRRNDRVGFIDTTGTVVIEPVFNRASRCQDGCIIVSTREGQNVMDSKGTLLLEATRQQIRRIQGNNYLLVMQGNRWQVLDDKYKSLVMFGPDEPVVAEGDWVYVRRALRPYFYHLPSGDTAVCEKFERAEPLGSGCWQGRSKDGWTLFRPPARILDSVVFQQLNRFVDDVAAYRRNDGWGYVDTTGKTLTPAVFGLAWDYRGGHARVAFTDGIAFLDGQQLLACRPPEGTTDLRDFQEGLAPIQWMKTR